jgi:hypothetical protein
MEGKERKQKITARTENWYVWRFGYNLTTTTAAAAASEERERETAIESRFVEVVGMKGGPIEASEPSHPSSPARGVMICLSPTRVHVSRSCVWSTINGL